MKLLPSINTHITCAELKTKSTVYKWYEKMTWKIENEYKPHETEWKCPSMYIQSISEDSLCIIFNTFTMKIQIHARARQEDMSERKRSKN